MSKEISLVKRDNAQQQDLLHMIENESFNASKGYQLAKTIKDLRVERRMVKNEFETLKQLKKGFVDESIKSLIQTAQDIRQKDELLNRLSLNKIYTPRIVDDELVFSNNPKAIKKQSKAKKKEELAILSINFKPNGKTKTGCLIQTLEEKENHYVCVLQNGNGYQKQTINKSNLILDK